MTEIKTIGLLLLCTLSFPLCADDKRLGLVKTICIGTIAEIGSDELITFVRTAIRFELTRNGFTVVDNAEVADAVLNLSAWSSWPNSVVSSLAVLKAPDGENIWVKEFQDHSTIRRAQAMAKTLRRQIAAINRR